MVLAQLRALATAGCPCPGVSGVMETGSTLAFLARQLHADGITHADNDKDARGNEQLPLAMRIKGAQLLLDKTQKANANWGDLVIFTKRERMYMVMKEENEDDSSILVSWQRQPRTVTVTSEDTDTDTDRLRVVT
jgi:hypothetical protein